MRYLVLTGVFTTFFSALNIYAQQSCDCNERLRNLAWYYYTQHRFDESLAAMTKAISIKETESSDTDYFILALAYSAIDSVDQAFNALLNAAKKGLNREFFESEDFKNVKVKAGAERWKEINNQYNDYHNQYKLALNLEYRLAVEQLIGSDQRIRSSKDDLRQQDYILFDSLNFTDLKKLFEKYGFPSMKKDGFNWEVVDVFMMHYSVESLDKYKEVVKLLEAAHSQCLSDLGDISVITDRRKRWIDQTAQTYGAWNLSSEKGVFGEIENVQEVDNRRFKYNLLRLKEQSELEGRALPKDYKPLPYPKDYFCGFSSNLK